MAKRKHPHSTTTIHHFEDGSGHTHHHHHKDPTKDVEYAHLDHDQMMDGLQQHLGGGEPEAGGEEAMEAGAAGGGAPGGM